MATALLILAACVAGVSLVGGLILGAVAAGRLAAWRADREREWIRYQLRYSTRGIGRDDA